MNHLFAITIGNFEFALLDIFEISVVAVLIYYIYRLIRGSIAVNIFIGIAAIYGLWFLVKFLEMEILETILGQFVDLGLIVIVILFQPEIRRFLLYVGKGSAFTKSAFFRKYVLRKQQLFSKEIHQIQKAILNLSIEKTGALIAISGSTRLQTIVDTGENINADISAKLIETIFDKTTPLHDGAMVISHRKILAAGCTLPVSENNNASSIRLGTRHKAAIGLSEKSDAIVFVVSEETGRMAVAEKGLLLRDMTISEIKKILQRAFMTQ